MGVKVSKGILIILILFFIAGCSESQEQRRADIKQKMDQVAKAFDEDNLTDSLATDAARIHLDYIHDYPNDSVHNPQYYYEALKLTTEAENYGQSLAIVDTFMAKYPNHKLAPYILHFKAYYIYERGLKDYPKAEKTYQQFLKKYPDHKELTSAVLFSLEHLGKSDDEVLQEILKKSDAKKNPSENP